MNEPLIHNVPAARHLRRRWYTRIGLVPVQKPILARQTVNRRVADTRPRSDTDSTHAAVQRLRTKRRIAGVLVFLVVVSIPVLIAALVFAG